MAKLGRTRSKSLPAEIGPKAGDACDQGPSASRGRSLVAPRTRPAPPTTTAMLPPVGPSCSTVGRSASARPRRTKEGRSSRTGPPPSIRYARDSSTAADQRQYPRLSDRSIARPASAPPHRAEHGAEHPVAAARDGVAEQAAGDRADHRAAGAGVATAIAVVR